VLLAAGTVTDGATARRAIDAGAEMIVSPCLVTEVIDVARSQEVAVVSGALTPTEILSAVMAGADLVKVFPASSVGGPAYLRALRGPFPDLELVPTGGVTLDNGGDFFRAGAVAVGVGGELVSRELLDKGDYAGIAAMAARFVAAVAVARGKSG
jgi:2-dehydro-3-deoxyphosphogluconate aldolase/(4S)-4-hydroxy-2-oxoglutarate aldolase